MIRTCFVDSGALVKRYVNEVGTGWVNALFADASSRLYVAHVTGVEVVAALARRHPVRNVRIAIKAFQSDFATGFAIIRMTDAVIDNAILLAQKYKLRGYDAVQLAAGVAVLTNSESEQVLFIASDVELLGAAKAEGFQIANPNDYP